MQFENCKYDNVQLADRFIKMAEKFLPYANNETCTLDMDEMAVIKHPCKTVACHGGYAGLIFNTGNWYGDGADALAKYLGFRETYSMSPRENLESWAYDNSLIWGNEEGDSMFSCVAAFGKPDWNDEATLEDVVIHYLAVAKRLLELPSNIVLTK